MQVNAARPSARLCGDPSPAFQLRQYACSAKPSLPILRDFEEFAGIIAQRREEVDDAI